MKTKLLFTTLILLTLTACGVVPTLNDMQATAVAGTLEAVYAETETANQIQTAVAATVIAQGGVPAEAPSDPGAPTAEPGAATPTPTPGGPTDGGATPIATTAPQDLELGEVGFSQEDRRVWWWLNIHNPNSEMAYTGVEYAVTITDASGKILAVAENVLPVILPGQETAFGSSYTLPADSTATSVTIETEGGRVVQTGPMPPVTGSEAVIWQHDDSFSVVGQINNPNPFFIDNISLYVQLYDAEGRIVGGGENHFNFVPAMGSNAVRIFALSENPSAVRAEIYPYMYRVPESVVEQARPEGAVIPSVVSKDFVELDDGTALLTVEIRNPNTAYAIPRTIFQLVGYAGDGSTRFIETHTIYTLGPEMSTVFSWQPYLGGSAEGLDRFEVIINETLEYEASGPLPPITFENLQIEAGGVGYTFIADVVNPFPVELENMFIYLAAYDADGELIYVYREWESVPAGATMVIDSWAPRLEIEPVTVEWYAVAPDFSALNE